jgi:hypothetical protein
MKLFPGDKITACLFETPEEPCQICGGLGYGAIVVQSDDQSERKIALCGRHFIKTCDLYPELRELAQMQMEQNKRAPIQPNILCPRCRKPLDPDKDPAYDVILASGVICRHCGATVIIERNIARLE